MNRTHKRQQRRGVLLLVILSLLALFSVVVITYVIVAGLTRRAAVAYSRHDQYETPPHELAERVMMDVLRGTRNPNSPLQGHDLLGDLYGEDWVEGSVLSDSEITMPVPLSDGSVRQKEVMAGYLEFTGNQLMEIPFLQDGSFTELDGYYNGLIITMREGPSAGQSRRIVEYFPPGSTTPNDYRAQFQNVGDVTILPTDQILPPSYDPQRRYGVLIVEAFESLPGHGDRFLINGRPFNGLGDSSLRPNKVGNSLTSANHSPDEDYDAVDYNNMALAMLMPLPQEPDGAGIGHVVPIPSYFRPDLVEYTRENNSSGWDNPNSQLRQRIIFRPLKEHNQSFQFVNNRLESRIDDGFDFTELVTDPPWDVDNDGDGRMDSIWIDPGYEVQTAPDGRRYKVLAAVLCVDLNGRLNLNAHGSLAHVIRDPDGMSRSNEPTDSAHDFSVYGPFVNVPNSTLPNGSVPRGLGFGPADVNLSFPGTSGQPLASWQEYANLMVGANVTGNYYVPGRYGKPDTDPETETPPKWPGPGTPRWIRNPGFVNLAQNSWPNYTADVKHTRIPLMYRLAANSSYQTPFDFWGTGVMALDWRGQPVYRRLAGFDHQGIPHPPILGGQVQARDRAAITKNNPYEFDLSSEKPQDAKSSASGFDPADSPFTVAELERLLRVYDKDADLLPNRISELAPISFSTSINAPRNRQLVTTTSFDLPAPNVQPLPKRNDGYVSDTMAPRHVIDLLVNRFRRAIEQQILTDEPGLAGNSNQLQQRVESELLSPARRAAVNRAIRYYLAPEVLAGRKMNLNRPFGDGRDTDLGGNQNGAVDEAEEFTGDSVPFYLSGNPPTKVSNSVRFYHNNGEFPGYQVNLNSSGGPTGVNTVMNGVPRDGSSGGSRVERQFSRQIFARHLYILAWLVLGNDLPYWIDPTLSTQSPPDATKLRQAEVEAARILAQWAVNVVDYRDRDSTMTYFEYDTNPFVDDMNPSGPRTRIYWNVDGDPSTDEGTHRDVVWGLERPELLISEALATHDRRTADKGQRRTDTNPNDNDYDQVRRPQGNLIVELFNPQNRHDAASELHAAAGDTDADGLTHYAVRLDTVTPTVNGQFSGVWRLVVGREAFIPTSDGAAPLIIEPSNDASQQPIERIGYFVNHASVLDTNFIDDIVSDLARADIDETAGGDRKRIPRFGTAGDGNSTNPAAWPILPGQYAIVAPTSDNKFSATSTQIFFGRRDPSQDQGRTAVTLGSQPRNRYPLNIELLPFDARQFDLIPGTPRDLGPALNDRQPAQRILMAPLFLGANQQPMADYAGNESSVESKLRFSISEPLDGYEVISYERSNGLLNNDDGFYIGENYDNVPYNRPFDEEQNDALPDTDETILYDEAEGRGTHQRKLYLQRLANPSRPWHRELNPYVTVDSMPLDLHVYTGEEDSDFNSGGPHHFYSRQRYGELPPSSGSLQPTRTIWPTDPTGQSRDASNNYTTRPPAGDVLSATIQHPAHYSIDARVTFGFLNAKFGSGYARNEIPDVSQTPVNESEEHAGDPRTPFPWFTWNNRPFTSEMELLLVPWGNAAELLIAHTAGGGNQDPIYGQSGLEPEVRTALAGKKVPASEEFQHLPNFFHSAIPGVASPTVAPYLYRLLEYVHVPSLFVGTESYLNAQVFGDPMNANADALRLRPPFHHISRYREPGRLNVNTIFHDQVWQSLTDGLQAPSFLDLVNSRRGYRSRDALAPADPFGLVAVNRGFPSAFFGAFRSFAGAGLNPVVGSNSPSEVDYTLLRRRSNLDSNNPLFSPKLYGAHNNPNRNPYFRYHGLQKMANLLTTRSNQYAVWITIGYFEVEPVTLDAVHPDGYALSRELGSDTGEIRRHRAFYIVDRTIPVGYQRGRDHNARNAIVLRRFIE